MSQSRSARPPEPDRLGMTFSRPGNRAAVVEVEMSRLQQLDADGLNIPLPADDLLSQKSQTFTHPQEVLDDQELLTSR